MNKWRPADRNAHSFRLYIFIYNNTNCECGRDIPDGHSTTQNPSFSAYFICFWVQNGTIIQISWPATLLKGVLCVRGPPASLFSENALGQESVSLTGQPSPLVTLTHLVGLPGWDELVLTRAD